MHTTTTAPPVDGARARAARLLRELLKKTEANGCTEAEAASAAAKVNELLAEYGEDIKDEAEVKGDRYGAKIHRGEAKVEGSRRDIRWHESKRCHYWVAQFCSVKMWYSGLDVVFFGSYEDTVLASGMVTLLHQSMDREWKDARRIVGARERASFMLGMADRLNVRLRDMVEARKPKTSQSTGLMVLKGQLVKQKYDLFLHQQGIKLRNSSGNRRFGADVLAHGMGRAAADRVGFNRPIGATKYIG